MNEQEQEKFEAELRRTKPARLPEHFLARLRAAKPFPEPARRIRLKAGPGTPFWQALLRGLAPAAALGAVALLVGQVTFHPKSSIDRKALANVAYGIRADDVQVDQELVSSFDVVATLPGGEPVRFRCEKWKDQLVVTDKSRGIEIEQSNPRVEVVPVRFETY